MLGSDESSEPGDAGVENSFKDESSGVAGIEPEADIGRARRSYLGKRDKGKTVEQVVMVDDRDFCQQRETSGRTKFDNAASRSRETACKDRGELSIGRRDAIDSMGTKRRDGGEADGAIFGARRRLAAGGLDL